MTTVTVYGGERTIGGTQIVVEDGGHRLLFDCGRVYDPTGDPFTHVQHRAGAILPDLLSFGWAPPIPGLYDPRFLPSTAGETGSAASAQGPIAVALSHAHLDHTHLVGFVDPSVPIHASPATARIVQGFSDLGMLSVPLERPITPVQPETSVDIGPMRIHFVPVDHDVCEACGFIIETSDGAIAYSGDLRMHGSQPIKTLSFALRAREARSRVLILEGTRLWPPPETPPAIPLVERVESDVVPDIMRVLTTNPEAPALILQSAENGERIEALAQALAHVGRLYVMDLESLTLAYAALGRTIDAPHAVYVPGTVGRDMDRGDTLAPAVAAALAAAPRRVEASEIAVCPEAFLLRLSFARFADLLDILPPNREGLLFHSNGSPLGRFDPAYTHLEWWCAQLGLQIIEAASTGHAAPRDLALIAAQSGAPVILSLHSRNPELMPVSPERLLLPERGRVYDLATMHEWVVARTLESETEPTT